MSFLVPTEWSTEPQPGHKIFQDQLWCEARVSCLLQLGYAAGRKGHSHLLLHFPVKLSSFPHPGTWTFDLWGGVRERGPRHRTHFEKSIWSLSLTGIQGAQRGTSAFTLGSTLSLWLINHSLSFSKDSWTSIPDGSFSVLGNPATPSASLPCGCSSPVGDPYLLWRILASFCPSNQMRLQPSLCRCIAII